jgi:Xaa-Pro aminopeptidase
MKFLQILFMLRGKTVLLSSEDMIDENVFYSIKKSPRHDNLVLVINKGKKTLLASPLEMGNYSKSGTKVVELNKKNLAMQLSGSKRLGLNYKKITLEQIKNLKKYSRFSHYDVSDTFAKKREIKSQKEIKKIKTACKIAEETLEKIPNFVRKFRTERGLAEALDNFASSCGSEGPAFQTIVASSCNSAIPHHTLSSCKIRRGFLLVDFGAKFDGYCSDITRTYFIGPFDKQCERFYNAVQSAKAAAELECFAGNAAKNAHIKADKIIEKEFGSVMMHSLGHGIGLNEHDFPQSINSKSNFTFKKNMCVTVEPGFYKKGYGGVRIEDDIIIRKGKCEKLTRAPCQLEKLSF